MSVVAFDTLKLARALREKGKFTPEQAEGVAEALSEAFREDIATKDDLSRESAALRSDMEREFAKLRAEMAAFRTDTEREFAAVRAEMANIRADMKLLEQRMTIKLGGMMVVSITVMATLVKLL